MTTRCRNCGSDSWNRPLLPDGAVNAEGGRQDFRRRRCADCESTYVDPEDVRDAEELHDCTHCGKEDSETINGCDLCLECSTNDE